MMLCRIRYKFDEARDENHTPYEDAAKLDGLAKSDHPICYSIAILITPNRSRGVVGLCVESSDDGSAHKHLLCLPESRLSPRWFSMSSKASEEGSQHGHAMTASLTEPVACQAALSSFSCPPSRRAVRGITEACSPHSDRLPQLHCASLEVANDSDSPYVPIPLIATIIVVFYVASSI